MCTDIAPITIPFFIERRMEMEGWGKPKHAAKYACTSERTLRSWLKQGLKHSRLSTGAIFIKYSDIDDFLKKFEVDENEADRIVNEVCREMGIK
ncbi:MAG: hypothetical protein JSW07_16355 [bacterium]|nr:MAG: hypothetical protein JSW07_16355 [bacterium]